MADRRASNCGCTDGERRSGSVVDRRSGLDRRDSDLNSDPVTGLERRRSAGRRRSEFRRAAEDGHMTREQFLFVQAIEAFKKSNGAMFPAWTDVLEVMRLLGYRKTMPSELNLPSAEDWRELADTPSGVRPDGWERRFTKAELGQLGDEDEDEGASLSDDDFDELIGRGEAA